MWHMPDDATEGVAEHCSGLQPSINFFYSLNNGLVNSCMPQLHHLCSAALVPNVLPQRDEGSGRPCAVIEA